MPHPTLKPAQLATCHFPCPYRCDPVGSLVAVQCIFPVHSACSTHSLQPPVKSKRDGMCYGESPVGRTPKDNELKSHSLNPDFAKIVALSARETEIQKCPLLSGRERTLKQDVTRKTKGQLTIAGMSGDLYGRLSA